MTSLYSKCMTCKFGPSFTLEICFCLELLLKRQKVFKFFLETRKIQVKRSLTEQDQKFCLDDKVKFECKFHYLLLKNKSS